MVLTKTHEGEQSVFLPLGLILILIMQLLVFIFIQLSDFTERQPARDFYFDQGLNKIEFPLYVKYLYRYMSQPHLDTVQQQIANGSLTQEQIYWLQKYDPFFQQYLSSEQSIKDNTLYYMQWQQKRREYLQRLTKNASYELGYKPANPEWIDFAFSFFMNSNLYQFICNWDDAIARFLRFRWNRYVSFIQLDGTLQHGSHDRFRRSRRRPCDGDDGIFLRSKSTDVDAK